MTGAQTLPAGFVNNGTVLYPSLVKVKNITATTSALTFSIQTYTGHTYQLQSATSLSNPAWANVTANVGTQTNGSGVMTFTLSAIPASPQFFRILVQ